MRVLNVMPVSYKGAFANKDNNVSPNYRKNVSDSVSFGNAGSILPDNFGTVIEKKLFRGGLPQIVDFKALKEKGVTFILDLCGENSKNEAQMAKDAGIEYIYRDGDDIFFDFDLDKGKISEVLQLVKEKTDAGQVGYVHCTYGEVRTGRFVAFYQSKVLGKALPEIEEHYIKHYNDRGSLNGMKFKLEQFNRS